MDSGEKSYADMSLDEFISRPDTVDFAFNNSIRFRKYIESRPYIKAGTVFGSGGYVVAYSDREYMDEIFNDLGADFLTVYPQLLTPLGEAANTAAGIYQAQKQPYLGLRGKDVIIGFVDTGIDYTKDAFRYEDGSSKIKYIWDQTIPGNPPANIRYGSVYTRERINEALSTENPASIVPTKDTHGHGTFLASVAAGRGDSEHAGAAPDCEIVAVKLKPVNRFHLDRFNYNWKGPTLYASTDFILGVEFILDRANEANLPAVICIGMGTSFGGHNGNTLLERYLSFIAQRNGVVCVAAAGNEGNKRHHTEGRLEKDGDVQHISLSVSEKTPSFVFQIIYAAYERISVEVVSPIGETTGVLPVRYDTPSVKKLTLEASVVTVSYFERSANVVIVDVLMPTPGIWNINLHAEVVLGGHFHAWLPVSGVLDPNVEFLKPTPQSTVVIPATAERLICVGAYNHWENSLYISSSWGPTLQPRAAPDFVAPGVNVSGVYPTGYGKMTGTSVAAAITAGACALLLEWGITRGNDPTMNQDRAKALLISGCRRTDNIEYPNSQWGFGSLDLINVFEFLKNA